MWLLCYLPLTQTSYSYYYYYVAGRPNVVLKKKNVVAEHNVPFQVLLHVWSLFFKISSTPYIFWSLEQSCKLQVYYNSNPIFMFADHSTRWAVVGFIVVCIAYFKFAWNSHWKIIVGRSLGIIWMFRNDIIFKGIPPRTPSCLARFESVLTLVILTP